MLSTLKLLQYLDLRWPSFDVWTTFYTQVFIQDILLYQSVRLSVSVHISTVYALTKKILVRIISFLNTKYFGNICRCYWKLALQLMNYAHNDLIFHWWPTGICCCLRLLLLALCYIWLYYQWYGMKTATLITAATAQWSLCIHDIYCSFWKCPWE